MRYWRKGIAYLLFSGLALYLAVIYNSKGILLFWGTVVSLPPIFLCILFPVRKKISYDISVPGTIQNCKDIEKMGMKVKNDSSFAVRIKGQLLLEHPGKGKKHRVKIAGRVNAGEIALLTGKWSESELGIWKISCEKIWIYEEFGWVCLKKKGKRTGMVMVLPECFETNIKVGIRTRLFFSNGEQYHPERNGDDPAEVLELREYREGDRLNRVHWKLSARNDILIVKELSMPVGCNVVFFLNVENGKQTDRKAYWEIVHTISAEMLEQECFYYLTWYEKKENRMMRKAVKTEEDLYEFWLQLPEYELQLGSLQEEYKREFPGEQYVSCLELNGKMELFCNDTRLEKFREEKIQKQLEGMELIL